MSPRPELELVHVAGQLELIADGDPCALCRRPTRQWIELCDDCNDAFQDLADALDPDNEDVIFVELDVDAALEAIRTGNMGRVSTMDLGSMLKLPTLTVTERDLVKGELWRRA